MFADVFLFVLQSESAQGDAAGMGRGRGGGMRGGRGRGMRRR